MIVLEEEGVKMDMSMEDWEKDAINIDFDEWLVLEMSEMYSPQLVTETSGTYSVLEGRGENINKDIRDTVHMETQTVHNSVHTGQKTSLPNVRKVQ